MIQGALFDLVPTDDRPVCANGNPSPWMPGYEGPEHCPACPAGVNAAVERFWEAVATGKYDADGYTPAERKAQERRSS